MSAELDLWGRTLVRLPSWVGDAVAAEPFVRGLYGAYRDFGTAPRLSLAGPRAILDLFAGRFEEAPRISHEGRGGERARAWRGHDTAILLTGSFRSAWTAWRARIPRRIGWSRDMRGFLLTDALRPPRERGAAPPGHGRVARWPRWLPRPVATSCLDLAAYLELPGATDRPVLRAPAEVVEAVRRRLRTVGVDLDEPFLMANVGSRPGSAKAWPARHWIRALDSLPLHYERQPILLVCGPGEEETLSPILESCRARSVIPLFEPALPLLELVALASRTRLFLTVDSGPRHVAEAAGAPVVCVTGPTDPRHSGHDMRRTEVLRVEVPCGPCHRERCPLRGPEHHACMNLVDPERVLAAARRRLE